MTQNPRARSGGTATRPLEAGFGPGDAADPRLARILRSAGIPLGLSTGPKASAA
jgi:hypothetical protein